MRSLLIYTIPVAFPSPIIVGSEIVYLFQSSIELFLEGRRKKEVRRKKEEGRRKKEEEKR
ncbi:MAG: hypothetical protein ACRC62_21460 [Microcoleus sp.]